MLYPVKIPAFQFYPADWRKDPAIQSLSFHDRSIVFESLCIMHESSERGRLLLNGKPMSLEVHARLLGCDKQTLSNALVTILESGALKRDVDGVLYSSRMVRDEEIRKIRYAAGLKGGNPMLKQKVNQVVNGGVQTPSNQTSEGEVEDEDTPKGGAGGSPTIDEVLTWCNMSAAIPKDCGTAFWNAMEACGWFGPRAKASP
jgi:hypothetical protein